jgi:hypothetical protein
MAHLRAALTMDWDFSTGANCCSAAKEIVRRRFLRIGQIDQRLRHEKRRTMNSSEQNTYPRWPDQYSSTDGQRKFRSAKYFLCFGLRF